MTKQLQASEPASDVSISLERSFFLASLFPLSLRAILLDNTNHSHNNINTPHLLPLLAPMYNDALQPFARQTAPYAAAIGLPVDQVTLVSCLVLVSTPSACPISESVAAEGTLRRVAHPIATIVDRRRPRRSIAKLF